MAGLMTPADKKRMYDDILGCVLDQIEAEEEGIAAATLLLFMEKSAGYGGTAINFGTKGELIEVSRKFWRLFGILEEGQPEVAGEGVEELCMDMIGHLWMMIWHKHHEDPVLAPMVQDATHYATPEGTVIGSQSLRCTCGGTGNSCAVHPMKHLPIGGYPNPVPDA